MKLGQLVKNAVVAIVAIGLLVGMIAFFHSATKSEPTGAYTATDMVEFYSEGYKKGAENMRDALVKANTDTTVKSCQE